MANVILVTGERATGKTTLINKLSVQGGNHVHEELHGSKMQMLEDIKMRLTEVSTVVKGQKENAPSPTYYLESNVLTLKDLPESLFGRPREDQKFQHIYCYRHAISGTFLWADSNDDLPF